MRTLRAHQNNQECYECAENPAERSLGFGAIILQQVGELQAEAARRALPALSKRHLQSPPVPAQDTHLLRTLCVPSAVLAKAVLATLYTPWSSAHPGGSTAPY